MVLTERLRARARRARSIASTVADRSPLTGAGLAFALMVGLAAKVGFREVDLVLLGAAGLGTVTLLFGALTVAFGAWRVRASLADEGPDTPLAIECGRPTETGFRLPRFRWIPGLRVTWRWTAPEAEVRTVADGPWLEEEVRAAARGYAEALERRIEVGDAFGLVRWVFVRRSAQAVRMLPAVGQLKQMHLVRTLAGGSDLAHPDGSPEGERFDLRQYAPGDPIRFVLWSVFARTRDLVVRTPERALSAARKTLAYLVSGDGDEPAAGAARVALEVGALGGEWAFGADGVDAPAQTRDAALDALARSRHAPVERQGEGLGAFLRRASSDGNGRAVVFVPGRPGPWLDGLVRAASGLPRDGAGRLPVEFMVCVDGVARGGGRGESAWLEPSAARPGRAEVAPDELSEVVARLGALRAPILLVDRESGRIQPQAR